MKASDDLRSLVRHLELHARRLASGPLAGDYRSLVRGRGMEFAALRPYEAGDDPRTIDPFASARSGTLHTRLYHEERARELLLLADLSASCTPAKRRLLAETAALLGAVAVGHRDRVGLIGFSDRIELLLPPAGGWLHLQRLLNDLLACQPVGRGTDLALPLTSASRLLRRSGLVILLSDFHAPWPAAAVDRCRARHELLAMVLRESREEEWPAAGLALLADAESGCSQLVDLGGREGIAAAWRLCDRELGERLRRHAIDHAILASDAAPLAALQRLLHRRRRR